MKEMSFVCDYAKISPLVLMYKIDSLKRGFATFKDVDEDRFVLYIFPWNELEVLSADDIKVITSEVSFYLYDPEDYEF